MASVSDTAGTARGMRPAGSGIELAGNRSASRLAAAQHTSIVRALKVILPVTSVLVTAGYAYVVVNANDWNAGFTSLDIPKIVAENLAMDNPHYEGFNQDGGRYWVTAKKAMQDLENLSHIKLDAISGELIDADKVRTRLTATRGTFDNKQNILELYDAIDVEGESGIKVHLTRASVQTKDGIINSDEPVSVAMPAGSITSKRMTIRQKTREYTFLNDVRTSLKAPPAETATAAAAKTPTAPPGFGNPNEPINIASNRLDINDNSKIAVFTGNVTAVQGDATLSSPEIEVTYEGSAAPVGDKDTKDKQKTAAVDGGKVKRVVAKNPVLLKQGKKQQVTSRSADFDTTDQKAVLEGDVIMIELPDRRAVGDMAEIDQTKDTVLLTGPVVLTQGPNELKGRRLFFDRANSKMALTAGGDGSGRISARFNQAQPSKPEDTKTEAPKRGVAFGGNFKTDPNAPIEITSARLDVDDAARQAVFNGDVKAQQAGFHLQAEELTANYTGAAGMSGGTAGEGSRDAAKLTRIRAKKNVQVTSKEGQKATGDWADYDTRANTVTLGGDVVMTQGKNVVRGTKLVIDMTSGESVISTEPGSRSGQPMISSSDGDGSGMIVKSGRPSAVFYPNEEQEKGGKAGKK